MFTKFATPFVFAALLAGGILRTSPARAGVIITDGKNLARGIAAKDSELTTRPMTTTREQQQVWLWAATVFNSHEAAALASLEDGFGHGCGADEADCGGSNANEGCSAAPSSMLGALLGALAVLRRRRS